MQTISPKDPDAYRQIVIDWYTWLDTGDTITSSTITSDDVTIESQSNDTRYSWCLISGGTVDTHAVLKASIVTTVIGERQPWRIAIPIRYE